jgi:hypothetical protein
MVIPFRYGASDSMVIPFIISPRYAMVMLFPCEVIDVVTCIIFSRAIREEIVRLNSYR